MIRWAILAMAAVTAIGVADAQKPAPGLEIYLDIDKARTLVIPPATGQQLQAAVATKQTRMKALQDKYAKDSSDLQRNAAVMPQADVIKAQRDLQDLQEQIVRARDEIDWIVSEARRDAEAQADLKIGVALDAYTKRNRLGLVVRHRSGAFEDDIIVLNPQFELATALSEMVKSGPRAVAPAHPKRAPVVKYAQVLDVMRLTDDSADQREEFDRIQKTYAANDRVLQDDLARWANISRTSGANEQREAVARIELLQLQVANLRRDAEAEIIAARERIYGYDRQKIAAFLEANPKAINADVLRLTTDGDGMTVFADPSLNVTAALASAMKGKP